MAFPDPLFTHLRFDPPSMTDITCIINYACNASETGAIPFTFAKLLGTDTHLSVRPISTLIRDCRPSFERGEGPKIGVEGFEVVKQKYEGALDGETSIWEETYAQDMAEVSLFARSTSPLRADHPSTVAASSSRCQASSPVWSLCS